MSRWTVRPMYWVILAVILLMPLILFACLMYGQAASALLSYVFDGRAFPWEQLGQFGDSFGAINAFLSAAAVILAVIAVMMQRKELQLQREEMERQREEMEKSRQAAEELTRLQHQTAKVHFAKLLFDRDQNRYEEQLRELHRRRSPIYSAGAEKIQISGMRANAFFDSETYLQQVAQEVANMQISKDPSPMRREKKKPN